MPSMALSRRRGRERSRPSIMEQQRWRAVQRRRRGNAVAKGDGEPRTTNRHVVAALSSDRNPYRGWLCRASPIAAKPPPLMAAVFPWNRGRDDMAARQGEQERRVEEKDQVSDVLELRRRERHHREREDVVSCGGGPWRMMEGDFWVFRVESSIGIKRWLEKEGRVAMLRSWRNELLPWRPCIFSWTSAKSKPTRQQHALSNIFFFMTHGSITIFVG
ncbi:hypothetical protein PIB30_094344, partial [Stylosanthes scabra]|nr:hypothetical protein [Stylosanthes scabra]